jgi:magnesium-transporting ATPase (P-type)
MEKTDGAIKEFWSMSPKHVYLSLGSREKGLSEQEAQRRLETYGYNEPESRIFSWGPILLRQFKSLISAVLIASTVILGFFATIDQASVHAEQVGLFTVANSARGQRYE